MTAIERLAFRHIRSFRREDGGLYNAYSFVYGHAYSRRMRRLHVAGKHGPVMANGRCEWCGAAS